MSPANKHDANVDLSFCPRCLTLCDASDKGCFHCGFPLEWIFNLGLYADYCDQILNQYSFDCHVLLSTEGRETEHVGKIGTELVITSHKGVVLTAKLTGPPYVLEILQEGNNKSFAIAQFGQLFDDISGIRLTWRLALSIPSVDDVPKVEDFSPATFSFAGKSSCFIGSQIADDVNQVADSEVALRHCMLLRQPESDDVWLVDLGTGRGTFLNGKPIVTSRILGGDVIQIAGYAWTFNRIAQALVPLPSIEGADLRLAGVAVENRLAELSVCVAAGQFVGIAGESGVGKSTLIKALLGVQDVKTTGRIMLGGIDMVTERSEYRQRLAYVPQKNVIHHDLTAFENIRFAARLRRIPISDGQISEILRRFDLDQSRWSRKPDSLSGGETQRACIASELATGASVVLLDEPAKGLDRQREHELMRMLKGLSIQGCTVIVITHGLEHLGLFDRVLVFAKTAEGGQLKFDGSPDELRKRIASREFVDLDLRSPPIATVDEDEFPSNLEAVDRNGNDWREHVRKARHQFSVLVRREFAMIRNSPIRRLILPAVCLPTFFALVIHWSVPDQNIEMLGFLSILAAIWMGGSLGLMSIVTERHILDHEYLLHLYLTPYVLAKYVSHFLMAVFQILVFLLLLSLLRADGQTMLSHPGWVAFDLILVSFAAVATGLVISAIARSRPLLANFILPMFMIVQIVFSVQVAGTGTGLLEIVYGEFNTHRCEGTINCPRRVEILLDGSWLCNHCRFRPRQEEKSSQDVIEYNRRKPNYVAAMASYFTFSRYGDIALRSHAYHNSSNQHRSKHLYGSWHAGSIFMLALFTGVLMACTIAVIWVQNNPTALRNMYRSSTHAMRKRLVSVSVKRSNEDKQSDNTSKWKSTISNTHKSVNLWSSKVRDTIAKILKK